MIATFTPTNAIETNYRDFYKIYINCVSSTYTTSDILNLKSIASNCPFTDGGVVYQARALYNIMNQTNDIFKDNCPQVENINSRLIKPNTNISNEWSAGIFPNPANDELFINSTNENEELKVNITDVSGKNVVNYLIRTVSFTGKIKLELNSGIYFVTLFNQYNEKVIRKLVVSK